MTKTIRMPLLPSILLALYLHWQIERVFSYILTEKGGSVINIPLLVGIVHLKRSHCNMVTLLCRALKREWMLYSCQSLRSFAAYRAISDGCIVMDAEATLRTEQSVRSFNS